jgi:hypothetical protein
MRPRKLTRLTRLKIFMRLRRDKGRETGHVQITLDSLAPRNVEMLRDKVDLIAMAATGMTFPLPAVAVRALKY